MCRRKSSSAVVPIPRFQFRISKVASPAGLEPATDRLETDCSIQAELQGHNTINAPYGKATKRLWRNESDDELADQILVPTRKKYCF
jgi:hypothetical protein